MYPFVVHAIFIVSTHPSRDIEHKIVRKERKMLSNPMYPLPGFSFKTKVPGLRWLQIADGFPQTASMSVEVEIGHKSSSSRTTKVSLIDGTKHCCRKAPIKSFVGKIRGKSSSRYGENTAELVQGIGTLPSKMRIETDWGRAKRTPHLTSEDAKNKKYKHEQISNVEKQRHGI